MVLRYIFLMMVVGSFCCAQAANNKKIKEGENPLVVIRVERGAHFSMATSNSSANNDVKVVQENDNNQKNDQDQSQVASPAMVTMTELRAEVKSLIANLHAPQPENKELKIPVISPLDSFFDWISNNKIMVSSVGVVTLYSYIFYQMYKADQILNDPLAWSNWHNNKKLEDFFAIPAAQLEADLLYAFQHRYIDATNPMDFMYSLSQSALALDKEIGLVRQQIVRYQWMARCRCSRLFFVSSDALADLQEKQRKLAFLKHIFSSWCAHHKIEKNN